jgi:hypothetical protein
MPPCSKIHNVFHVVFLMSFVVHVIRRSSMVVFCQCHLARLNRGNWEVLVRWMRQAAGAATWETLDELKQDDLDFQLEDELFACWEGKYYHKPLLPPSGLSVFLLVLYSFGDHLLLLRHITKRCPRYTVVCSSTNSVPINAARNLRGLSQIASSDEAAARPTRRRRFVR